jgi:hypothetical protein
MKRHIRDHVSVEFIMAVADSFEKHGAATLRQVLETDPDAARTVLATVLSKRDVDSVMEDPAQAMLEEATRRIVANARRGTPAEGKPRPSKLN